MAINRRNAEMTREYKAQVKEDISKLENYYNSWAFYPKINDGWHDVHVYDKIGNTICNVRRVFVEYN
jgi:hypothetical protein